VKVGDLRDICSRACSEANRDLKGSERGEEREEQGATEVKNKEAEAR